MYTQLSIKFAALVTLALGSQPVSADICGNNASWKVWVCWVEAAEVSCGWCRNGTTIYDRSNCQDELATRHRQEVYRAYLKNYRDALDKHESAQTEAYIRIGAVDTKLVEMINAQGNQPVNQGALDEIRQIKVDLVTATADRTGLMDQLSRIEQRLVSHPDDDLTQKLTVVRNQLIVADDKVRALRKQLASLYAEFADANSGLIDEETYAGLLRQRSRAVSDLEGAQRNGQEALKDSLAAARTLRMLEDANFVYEHVNANYPESRGTALQFMRTFEVP